MSQNPPSYDEAIKMYSLCPCPVSTQLLQPGSSSGSPTNSPITLSSLDELLYPLPATVTFSSNDDDHNSFYIRDIRKCVLIKVVLSPGFIYLYNANGVIFLTILTTRVFENVGSFSLSRSNSIWRFTVIHDRFRLGVIDCIETDLNSIVASNHYNKYDFAVTCMGHNEKDIVIAQAWNSRPPLCQANVPFYLFGSNLCFNATLVFPTRVNSITKVEQCLCIATVIALIVTRNNVMKTSYSRERNRVCCTWFVFTVFIVVLFCAFMTWGHSHVQSLQSVNPI